MRHWWKTDAEGGDGEDRPGTGGPSPLITRLREAGTEQELTGKTPFFLDGKERVWCLLEGQADVFFSSRSGNIQTGAREYLFTARRGDLLFGVEPPPRGRHDGQRRQQPRLHAERLGRPRLARRHDHADE